MVELKEKSPNLSSISAVSIFGIFGLSRPLPRLLIMYAASPPHASLPLSQPTIAMIGRKRGAATAASPISIGNCIVELDGADIVCESTGKGLHISSPAGPKIKISVDDAPRKYMTRSCYNNLISTLRSRDSGGFPLEDHEFVLLNPKDVDSCSKSLLQKVLKLYMDELPTMNYAANTGKESVFLERCVSGGKYRTLILRSLSVKGPGEVIAAVTYQIIPTDTQYAEIPLAAVGSKCQRRGIGCLLYNELRERLWNVGVLTIFCWADTESAGFWLKQGFMSIGEVDSKGKARRLPVKADIRRALCFPGGSTLMVAHVKRDTKDLVDSSKLVRLHSSMSKAKSPGYLFSGTALLENSTMDTPQNDFPTEVITNPGPQIQETRRNAPSTRGDSHCSSGPCHTNSVHPNNLANCTNVVDPDVIESGHDSVHKHCSSGRNLKRSVLEASSSSFKSKRVRGDQLIDFCQDTKHDFSCDHNVGNNSTFDGSSSDAYGCQLPDDIISKDSRGLTFTGPKFEDKRSNHISDDMVLKGSGPRIILMNIADEAKKTFLTEIVEKLGGSVTCNGSISTHVITGKARRTLNFCIALCSGAWIVSPHWLKASFREGKFLDESEFILEDEEYRLKHKSELREAVNRARANPHSLLRGFDVCLAKHIQPSVNDLSAIIKSAGGNVIHKLDSVKESSRVIFVVCEEDMEEAMVAARKRVWTFSSDWLMKCVMKQQLDLEAPQFAESL